jgi:hypothetical protein
MEYHLMPVAIKGSGGGSVTLDAGAAAADTTLTLPNTSGTVINTAPSTVGNVLTSNGTAWVSSAPAGASLTLLATLTTTSGTTQSATGLATTYANLVIVYEGVHNSTGNDAVNVAASSTNGAAYGAAVRGAGSSPSYGSNFIFRANANVTNHAGSGMGSVASIANNAAYIATNTAAPINALQFSWATGYTFNAGAIYIYGWN